MLVMAVRYDRKSKLVVLELSNGAQLAIPADKSQGVATASEAACSDVTTLSDSPSDVYHPPQADYVKRGHYPERGIQELKHGLAMDRLSSHRFLANAFTLQCHVLALAIWTLCAIRARRSQIQSHWFPL